MTIFVTIKRAYPGENEEMKNAFGIQFFLIAIFLVSGFGQTADSSFYQKKGQWSQIVDDLWGAGDDLATKQSIFNTFADHVEKVNPLFGDMDLDWDSLRTTAFNQIEASTSKGRFSAIMAHLAYALDDLHFRTWDLVLENTYPNYGVPVFYLNSFDVDHSGISLTTLDDGSIVVVKAAPDHPLGLVAGDIILGYEGQPWSELTEELFNSGIPLGGWYGSTPESQNYVKMTNAGQNWHLFQTMDVVKHASGDTVQMSTSDYPAYYFSPSMMNNPQLPVAGVPFPDFDPSHPYSGVSSGIVEGTNTGYIYVSKHNYESANPEFAAAVNALKHTDGLIIDIRWNTGGFVPLYDGYSLLFDFNFKPLQIMFRCNETDLYSLCEQNFPYWFNWNQNDPSTSYDKPIAVLIGPQTQSFGDIFARTMSFHPQAKFFGRPTNGAFSGQLTANKLDIDGWHVTITDFTMADTTGLFIPRARKAVEPDVNVWLSQEDVVNGDDTVVETALEWITSATTSTDDRVELPGGFNLHQNHPNPFNPATMISYDLPAESAVNITIFDIQGREVRNVLNAIQSEGNHEITWDGVDANGVQVNTGVYLCRVQTGNESSTIKMLLLK